MRIGLKHPAFIGMSSSTITRNTYSTAARVTGSGALKFVGCCGDVPVKSTVASRLCLSTLILTLMIAPWSETALRLAVGKLVDHAAHAFVGVILNVAHIGLDHFEAKTSRPCA